MESSHGESVEIKGILGVVRDGFVEATSETTLSEAQRKTLDEARLKDLKAKNYLFSAIDKTILKTITLKDTSKQLWDSMKVKYQGNSRVKRAQLQTLRRNFELLEMKTGESVTDYFARVMVVANDMRNYGDDMQDVKIVEKTLRTLTENFNYIVCSIEESKDIDNLSVDALQSSLLVHEQKLRRPSNGGDDQVLKDAFDDRGGRGRGRMNQGRGRGRGGGGGRAFNNKAMIECFKCHRLGHFQYECPSWDGKVNYAEVDEERDVVLLKGFIEAERKYEAWFLDSGCSNHMCGNKAWFSILDEDFRHSVKLGNNSQLQVMGKGDVSLQMEGGTHSISDVYFVPDLRSNLLSIGQLLERGCEVLIKHGVFKLFHPRVGLVLQSPMTANKLFRVMAAVNGSNAVSDCFQATSMDEFHLWHRRYGHLNYKGLRTLKYQNMVKGIPHLKSDVGDKACVSCLTGKKTSGTYHNWCTLISVARFLQYQTMAKDTSLPSSTTSVERSGFIFCQINLIRLLCSQDLNVKWRGKREKRWCA